MSSKKCSLLGCACPHHAKGFCKLHYERQKSGRPLDAIRGYRYGPEPFFDWAACGTAAQYKKHLRHGIPVCEPCLRAESRRTTDSRRRDPDKMNARRRELWAANPELYRRRKREYRAAKR